jgi:hypothetical protein
MILNVLIITTIFAIILYFPCVRIVEYVEQREKDKHRQAVKRYYMTMYFDAPSEREAEYWLDKYNKGE